jgi:hypothetical protein
MNQTVFRFKSLLFSLLMFLFLSPALTAMSSTQFTFSPTQVIQTAIAYGQVNRIQVTSGEIMEVVGDENQYQLYWSGDYRNLFIAPKVEVGKTIELSLVLAGGMVQDIRFTVVKTAAQTIFINTNEGGTHLSPDSSNKNASLLPKALKLEIPAMVRAMAASKSMAGKYYVINANRMVFGNSQMNINQTQAYRYLDLSGAVLIVQNTSGKLLKLSKEDFKSIFKDSVAISIETTSLKPRARSRVFVITRNNNDQ